MTTSSRDTTSDKHPLAELPHDKVKLIGKYRLVSKKIGNKLHWVREFGNRPDHPYATHRAVRRCSTLELVFGFYDLCVAKMTYFAENSADYAPCKMNYRTGEIEYCDEWDMELLSQTATGILIDLRNLAAITDIVVFREMCAWLEQQQQACRNRRMLRAAG